ncbi:MAG: UDP-glucose--hexose-1-phosphate uridylyltransferase [Lentisphaeria bacterium]|nr:UDP-glucose--hexose-1-phosphate uridylyltransferase [Lentisphaeria bacterium]
MPFDVENHPHRRRNALTGEWVLVSPHRAKRPWKGKVEALPPASRPAYDPACYLCPRNTRAAGVANPDYANTYVFENDFRALLDGLPAPSSASAELFRIGAVAGTCRVLCFSPRHDLTLPNMAPADIRRVVDVWAEQVAELGHRYRWVQVFENKGDVMGCSNPHPHGQIWAGTSLPNEPAKEDHHQAEYFRRHRSPLLLDYAAEEISRAERLVDQNRHWVVLVPFWAVWPYELLLLPRQPVAHLDGLDEAQRDSLAAIMKRFLRVYDGLFDCSFPYSMGWHGAPAQTEDTRHWQLHAHYYPPLLRSATVRKFMVGYEMLAEAQRDISAEQAAATLRTVRDRLWPEPSPAAPPVP